jgi:uncharacterized protein (TIGR02594 family)
MSTWTELSWIAIGRAALGQREIPGAKHNNWIVALWKRLKVSWFTDDEVPWCGAFVGFCCAEAGLSTPPPGEVGRALSWATHGLALDRPAYGCIAVKTRNGGGHVGFVVGRDERGRLMILGGNQDNSVSIAPYDESVFIAFRWPSKMPDPRRYHLPMLASNGKPVMSEA